MKKGGFVKRTILTFWGFFLIFVFVLSPHSFVFASAITKTNIIELTNQERVKAGLSILYPNYKLGLAAQNKANHMLANGYWEHYHNGKAPWDWMRETGYEFTAAGENLAIDFTEAEPVIQAWMDSATHRQNIINSNFREIGIGIAKGYFQNHQTIIVVQMFGKPKNLVVNYNEQIAGINGFVENDEGLTMPQEQEPKGFWANIWFKIKLASNFIFNHIVSVFD